MPSRSSRSTDPVLLAYAREPVLITLAPIAAATNAEAVSASPWARSRDASRSQKSPHASSEIGYLWATRSARSSDWGLLGMRGLGRLVDVLADRGDRAEALGTELRVVDHDAELALEPRDHLEQPEAVHDAALEQVEVLVELLRRDVRHELVDDELLDLHGGVVSHWLQSSHAGDACDRSCPSKSSVRAR